MDALGPWHIIIIVAFVVILFGAKKLPDAARSLGRSARIMKSEMKGLHDEPAVEETPAGPVEAARPVLADEVPVRAVLADEVPVRPVRADEVPVTARHNGTR